MNDSNKLLYHSQVLKDLHSRFNPHVGQARVGRALFYEDKNRIFVECGRKWGKTEILIYILYRICLMTPNSWCYYILPYQKMIDDVLWNNGRLPYFLDEKMMKKYGITINNTEKRVSFGNGSFVRCDGSDNYEAGRGYSATGGIVYDEYKDHNPKFHDSFKPNLAINNAPLIIFGTPPDESEESYDRWVSMADSISRNKNGFFINQPSHTNPHISKQFLEEEEADLRSKGELWKWEKEYLAMRVKASSGTIFPMLDKSLHVRPYSEIMTEILNSHHDWNFHIAFDPGSAKCFAVLLSAVNKYSKKVYLLDEIYATNFAQNSAGAIVKLAKEKMFEIMPEVDRWSAVYDYAATWFQNEYQSNYDFGLFLNKCEKDLKNKENKLSLIKDMLLGGFLQMTDRCEKTYWEMSKYSTEDGGKIKKENDHCFTGDTLISTENGPIEIKDIKVGCMVNTRYGKRRVYKVWNNGEKEIYKLSLSNGISVNLTLGHKIYTLNRGFVEVQNLKRIDILCMENVLRLNLKDRFINYGLILKIRIFQCILDVLKGN